MKIILLCFFSFFISHSELLVCQEISPEKDKEDVSTTKAKSGRNSERKVITDETTTEELLKENTSGRRGNSFSSKDRNRVSWSTYIQMFLVLVFILFLIFIFFYLTKGRLRKNFVGNNGIEILARSSILPKQSILILKVGPKILIVNSHINGAMNTLTEFTNAEDIEMVVREIEKPSSDNIFQTLLKRNEVLYDEELANPDKELERIEKKVDQVEDKFEV